MVDFTPTGFGSGGSVGTDATTAFPTSTADSLYGTFNPYADPNSSQSFELPGASVGSVGGYGNVPFDTGQSLGGTADSMYGSYDPFGGGANTSTAGSLTGASGASAGAGTTTPTESASQCSLLSPCLPSMSNVINGMMGGAASSLGQGSSGSGTCGPTNWTGCFPNIGDFASRAVVVILGFIFVAAGLFMFGRTVPFIRHAVPNVLKP